MTTRRSLHALAVFAAAVAITGSSRRIATARKPSWRAQFTAAASAIRLDSGRAPMADSGLRSDAAIPDSVSGLKLSLPLRRDSSRTGSVVFVITSSTGYPRLGIARGKNYFWRDFSGGQWRLLVIPADTLAPAYWLALRPHSHIPPQPHPRLLMLSSTSMYGGQFNIQALSVEAGTCMGCDMAWCISHDTQPRFQMTALPTAAIAAYFKRIGIAWPPRATKPAGVPGA